MYRSPIEIFKSQIELQLEGDILKAVQKHRILVDKEELMKALAYDRGQYSKGYHEGRESAFKETMEQLEAEIESSDKYIREYDDSEVQKAYNKGLRDALDAVKGVQNE